MQNLIVPVDFGSTFERRVAQGSENRGLGDESSCEKMEDFPPLGSADRSAMNGNGTGNGGGRPALSASATEFVPSGNGHSHAHGHHDDYLYAQTQPHPTVQQSFHEAQRAFDEAFPTLGADSSRGHGGSSASAAAAAAGSTHAGMGFLQKQRLMALQERFGWVHSSALSQALAAYGYALHPTEAYIKANYPPPPGWAARQRARASAARRGGAGSSASAGRTRETGDWVATGHSVAQLYQELRSQAGEFARQRNAAFDRARVAKLSGSTGEAARLAAEGHRLNDLMFEKHNEAANAIFEHRNPPDSRRRGILDLHGLHVQEALERLPEMLAELAGGGNSSLKSVRILTGSGHHCKGTGTARLRPAVEKWLTDNEFKYKAVEDKNNHVGAFVVAL